MWVRRALVCMGPLKINLSQAFAGQKIGVNHNPLGAHARDGEP